MRFLEKNFTNIIIAIGIIYLLFELPIKKWYVILILIAVGVFLGLLYAYTNDFIYQIKNYFTKNKK